MGSGTRIALEEARALANEIAAELRPFCTRLEVAGSIRRQRPDVGDIEICAIGRERVVPGMADLFGAATLLTESYLEEHVTEIFNRGLLTVRLDVNGRRAIGRKYKRLAWRGFPLDLFITQRESWGSILAIRTGPWEFSNALVTQANKLTAAGHRGLLPPWAVHQDGVVRHKSGEPTYPMREEQNLLDFCGIGWIEPENREAWLLARREGGVRV